MAKSYSTQSSTFAQHLVNFNELVNKVGDLANLKTTDDSSLVEAINASLDSAELQNFLDSGNYLSFDNLTASTDSDFVLTSGDQTIGGVKTLTSDVKFTGRPVVERASNAIFRLRETTRDDSSQVLRISHNNFGSFVKWTDSIGGNDQNLVDFMSDNTPGNQSSVNKIRFYVNNAIEGNIDSSNYQDGNTLLTQTRSDARYLKLEPSSITSTIKALIVDHLYPVGSIYFSTVSTNPGTLYPGTTWVAWGAGRVPVGVGTSNTADAYSWTSEQERGKEEHTLTIAEQASHNHPFSATTNYTGDHRHYGFWSGSTVTTALSSFPNNPGIRATAQHQSAASSFNVEMGATVNDANAGSTSLTGGHQHSISGTTGNDGGGGAHNNLQPSIGVYMFKRTA